jgi:hypothetical protein
MINNCMQAYTYSIRHLPTNKIYYGVRKSTTADIGTKYFSSSKLIKQMLQMEPIENFKFRVRKIFLSYEEARMHETRVLTRIKAVTNPMVLNQAISSLCLCSKNPIAEIQRRKSISKTMKELWQTPDYKNKQTFHILSEEERARRGRLGATVRADNYSSGKLRRKEKKTYTYRDTVICKNGIYKTVKSNQVPAYAKSGWSRT